MNKAKDWKRLLTGVAAGAVLAAAAAAFLFFESGEEDEYINEFAVTEEVEDKTEEEITEDPVMKVDIKGAVSNEGVYTAAEGDRIEDIVRKAGGLADDANPESINLAQRVEDQMVIHVMRKGEELKMALAEPQITGTGKAPTEAKGQKININSASEEELQNITGIGPSKASAIIQYREEQGPFSSVEDLMNISGIGEKTFEKMKDQVTI